MTNRPPLIAYIALIFGLYVLSALLSWGLGLSVALIFNDIGALGLTFIIVSIILPIFTGWTMDRLLGDPESWHPIVGFGRLISWGERRLNKGRGRAFKGFAYNALLVLLIMGLGLLLGSAAIIGAQWPEDFLDILFVWGPIYTIIHALVLFLMLSGTTLIREVEGVFRALDNGLEQGRKQVARIVGRDTASLSEQEVRTAALETLSENLSDGVVAPLFWYGLLGLPGLLGYKMINTQDSMIGYLNERYRAYGRFSAKLDDIANYIPARLTACMMIVTAGRTDLFEFIRTHGSKHLSPNSGYPEAALAGILGCRFGGPHDYFVEVVDKPYIGDVERPLTMEDLKQAVRINRRTELAMLAITALLRISSILLLANLFL